jgi:hypothetical protein
MTVAAIGSSIVSSAKAYQIVAALPLRWQRPCATGNSAKWRPVEDFSLQVMARL